MIVNETTKNLIVIENIRVNKLRFANAKSKKFTTEFNIDALLFDCNPVRD